MEKANPLDNANLKEHQARLHAHPLYAAVNTIEATRLFMERHCFAVWDFFLLIKDLQRDITNTRRFWTPCADVNAARFINEIVIGEETDDSNVDGQYLSHFELYVKAMDEIGANSQPIKDYVNSVSKMTDDENTYEHIEKRIDAANSPAYVKKFNKNTCQAIFRTIPYTAGQFFFGREDPIPQMFTKIVKTLDDCKVDCPTLKWYLNRHIEVDGSFHGPKTAHLITHLGNKYDPEFKDIIQGAVDAIQHRIWLWDGILEEVNKLGQ